MADATPMPGDIGSDPGAPAPGEKSGLLASPAAKIVVIVGAVVVLLAIAGVVIGLVLLNLGRNAVEQATVNAVNTAVNTAPSSTAATASAETSSSGAKVDVPVTNKDVFTARDPFSPVLEPLPPVSADATMTGQANTLTLREVADVDGTLKAILLWDGVQYTAATGEQLGDSPWQVLSITKTTVTMLYGDVQVTLSIGEGIAKD